VPAQSASPPGWLSDLRPLTPPSCAWQSPPLLVVADCGIVIGMAPKREGTPINVRLPDDMIAKIDHRRTTTGQTRAEAIRKMLAWALAQPKDWTP